MKISKRVKNSLAGYIKNNPHLSGKFMPICKWYFHTNDIYFVYGQIAGKYLVYNFDFYEVDTWADLGKLKQIPDEIIDQIKAENL